MTSIIFDTREPTEKIKRIVDKLLESPSFKDISVKYEKLDTGFGDVKIENNDMVILIERKQIQDFMNSYGKGDLKEKLFAMRQNGTRTLLMIEGHYETKVGNPYMTAGMSSMKIQTYCRFLINQMEKGVWIYFTNNLFETLYTIFLIAENIDNMIYPSPSFKCGSTMEWLVQLPGVGPERLKKLKQKYKNPVEALKNVNEWANKTIMGILEQW